MLAVLDTNVLVSGLLSPAGPPGKLLEAVVQGELIPVYADAIIEEYTEVLFRPELALDRELVLVLLEAVHSFGTSVEPAKFDESTVRDPDDVVFYATALAAQCPLVTGNMRDYPETGAVEMLTPRNAVEQLPGNQG